jgi:serine/threonine protein kinase/lipopolysaccharide biosynthesis regulator YciM
MTESKPSAREIFETLVELDSLEQRARMLAERCGGDDDLRMEVESLLEAHDQAGTFLESPPAAVSAAPLRPEVGSQVGPYRIREQIGEGGFGLVFVAEQLQPVRRTVALKLIKPGMDSREVVARFEAERQALAMMDHPHIAKVFDAGTTESGHPYFVMELVHGVPITDYCDQNSLTPLERIELFVAVCHAVQHAHQKGIIHRDLKPTNVLVTTLDGRPIPKVIDFGVAKAIHQQLTDATIYTRFHQMLGTPLYMSPEQAEMTSADIDTRSDIYSLGVLLYELITGTTPFDQRRLARAAFDEIRRIIREEDPPRPSTRLSESKDRLASIAAQRRTEPAQLSRIIQGELDWIIMKALEKERARRYATADNLAKDIERFLQHEPVEAGPVSRSYRLRKFARRHRASLVTGASLLGLLLAGTGVSTWQAIRASRAEAAAIDARQQEERARQAAVEEAERAERAAQAERTAKDEAEKRLGQLEKANQILASVFQNLDPGTEEKEGKPLRAILGDRLDEAIAQLSGDAIGDPRMTANLQVILGKSLIGLGLAERSVELLRQASDTLASVRGAADDETLAAMNALAAAHRLHGDLDQALKLLNQVVSQAEKKLGATHVETLIARQNLAVAYREAGKLDQALPYFEAIFADARRVLGPLDPQTLAIQDGLAVAYLRAGQRERAIELGEEILEPAKTVFGASHPKTIAALGNLASAYKSVGKFDRAISLQTKSWELSKARFGPEHPETLTALNNLGTLYWEAGQVDKAMPLLEDTLRLHEIRYGEDNPNLLGTQNNLALAYLSSEQPQKAVPLFKKVLRSAIVALGAEHPNTISTLNNLASSYMVAHEYEKGLPYLEQAAGVIERSGFQHQYTGRVTNNLSNCYEQLNRPADGERWLRQWLAVAKERDDPQSLVYSDAPAALGRNLLHQQRWADAEPYLQESLAIRQRNNPDSWVTFHNQSLLGEALLGQQKFEDAEPLLIAGYEGMAERESKIPGPLRGYLADALQRLVRLYENWQQPAKARQWQEQLDARRATQAK